MSTQCRLVLDKNGEIDHVVKENGQRSELFDKLAVRFGGDKFSALSYYSLLDSEDFKTLHSEKLKKERERLQKKEGKPTEADARAMAQIYKSRLEKLKSENPNQYWSVDMPSDEVINSAARDGRIVDTNGGMGIVEKDGNMVGLFKYNPEERGTAKAVQLARIAKGGIKLDNFDGYLTELYKQVGFKVVSRLPFNKESTPLGWKEEVHGTPDVVFMILDPQNKLPIEERLFNDYDEAKDYRDSFVDDAIALKSGKQNTEFFEGKAREASSLIPYEPVLDVDQTSPVAKAYSLYTAGGNFTGHISKMIAGFQEKQKQVAEAIVKGGFKSFLDLGTSEGGMIKTVASQDKDIIAVGVDPNLEMQKNFYSTPPVENAEYRLEAFQGSWVENDGTVINEFKPEIKFDVVNEDFMFQFVNNNREKQVKGVKEMMTPDGIFVTSEKFHTANEQANEAKKYDHQRKYFSPEQLTEDKQTIVSGMADDMVNDVEYFNILKDNFKHVVEFWNAGNFKGYLASDNLEVLTTFKNNVGDLTSEFTDESSLTSEEEVKYLDAVERGDLEEAQKMVIKKAEEAGVPILTEAEADTEAYEIRKTAPPKKTVKAYKLFKTKRGNKGEIFPLFVGEKTPLPMDVWLDAKSGPKLDKEENKSQKVKSTLGPLKFRPGWHAGDLPLATHIGLKETRTSPVWARRESEVWAEVEFASDIDYQPEADANGLNDEGVFIDKNADLDYMPTDGFYRYATNAVMTGKWLISGSMKINKILTEEEVNTLLRAADAPILPWSKKVKGKFVPSPLDLKKLGLSSNPYQNQKKLLDPVTYDDNGNIIPLSKRFDSSNSDIRFSKSEKTSTQIGTGLDAVVDKLKEAGLSSNVYQMTSEEIEDRLLSLGESDISRTTNGFIHNNDVYLNVDTATEETAIHEFNHLYNKWLKQNRTEIYQKGISLIKSQLKRLSDGKSSEIKDVIDFVRTNQPDLEEEALEEEILTELVGRKGLEILKEQQGREGILGWLEEAWEAIKNMLGLSDYTYEQISKMKLEDFVKASAVDLLNGKVLTIIDETVKTRPIKPFKDAYSLSFVKPSDIIDFKALIADIQSKNQKVWFWMADQLGRGDYKDNVTKKVHYLDAGLSYAFDPENREKGIIWATGLKEKELKNKTKEADYIFLISGAPLKAKLFNNSVQKVFTDRIKNFSKFKKDVLESTSKKNIIKFLEDKESFEDFKKAEMKNFIIALLGVEKTKTPLKEVLKKYNAFVNFNELRDGFLLENNFEQGDVIGVLKPTKVGGKSNHSTYETDLMGEVVGVPDIIVNSYDLIPKEDKKGKNYQYIRNLQMSYTAPMGKGISVIREDIKYSKSPSVTPETSSNYANLTEDGKGNFVFYHVGSKGYKEIKRGTGQNRATNRQEALALSRVGGVAMYYPSDDVVESMVRGDAKYLVKVPKGKVYDYNSDPLNFIDEAEAQFRASYPNQAFDRNHQLAFVTKVAVEKGYEAVVANWGGVTRVQTLKEFVPEDTRSYDGDTIVKDFKQENQFESNRSKGWESIPTKLRDTELGKAYEEISKAVGNNYSDKLYRLRDMKSYSFDDSFAPFKSQEAITEAVANSESISKELKDMYFEALNSKDVPGYSKFNSFEEPSVEDVLNYANTVEEELTPEQKIDLQDVMMSLGVESSKEAENKLKEALELNGLIIFDKNRLLKIYDEYEVDKIMSSPQKQEEIKSAYKSLKVTPNFYLSYPKDVKKLTELNAFGMRKVENPYLSEELQGVEVSVKVVGEDGNLVDKTEGTDTKDILERTFIEVKNPQLSELIFFIGKTFSPQVWEKNKSQISKITSQIKKLAIKNGVDLKGIEEKVFTRSREDILSFFDYFEDFLVTGDATYFSDVYNDMFDLTKVVTKRISSENKFDVAFEGNISEYEAFSKHGLVRRGGDVYRKVKEGLTLDKAYEVIAKNEGVSVDKLKEEVKNSPIETSDFEVDSETLELLQLYKRHFKFPKSLPNEVIKPQSLAKMRKANKWLLETNNPYFKMTKNGLEPISNDSITRSRGELTLPEYLKEEIVEPSIKEDLNRSERELAINNPQMVQKIKGDFLYLEPEVVAIKNETASILKTPRGIFEIMFTQGNIGFYGKVTSAEERPLSDIDYKKYAHLENSPEVFQKAKKYYSKEELDKINSENFSC